MPRNTTGGKNFKKFKSGGEGFRAKASREAADSIVGIIVKRDAFRSILIQVAQRQMHLTI